MDIAVCINKKFLQHFYAMLSSLATNTSLKKIRIHIIHRDFNYNDMEEIRNVWEKIKIFEFFFYKMNNKIFKNIPIIAEHLTVESLYRLDLARILPNTIERVVYLDSDLIVLGDIRELNEIDISNYYVAAVEEIDYFLSENLSLETPRNYFNAGVMILNLKIWRENNFRETLINYAKTTSKMLYCLDQDILNGVLRGNWLRLPPEWNITRSYFDSSDIYMKFYTKRYFSSIKENPKIIHYTTQSKPWHYFDKHPYKEKYFYYLDLINYKYKKYPELDLINNTNTKFYIFGASKKGIETLKQLQRKIKVEAFIDNDPNKKGTLQNKVMVESAEVLSDNKNKVVIIGSQYVNEISEQLEKLGYNHRQSYFKDIESFELKYFYQ
jgi:lipopolysaccharide biosynthesis glycosyltransferase